MRDRYGAEVIHTKVAGIMDQHALWNDLFERLHRTTTMLLEEFANLLFVSDECPVVEGLFVVPHRRWFEVADARS